ncbi:MAG: 50S ribosome-binding GTPase, partial [Candidatus Falkowbacteria bacterium]|nr:50S ribosome-binding GTPase [Candidatus Falkowbacteria bacterium]
VEEKIKETDMANEDEEAEEDALSEESEAGEDKEVSQSHRYKDKVSLDINVCILGKPNAGKSSLMNTILGTERVIVSDIPHTTRESQDSIVDYEGKKITFVDTAGFSRQEHRIVKKKKSRIHPEELKTENDLFMLGMASSLTALKRADIAIFVIDITQDITLEESKILEEIGKKKKSIIILANKWDKVDDKDTKKYTEYIYNNFPFIAWAPIHFASAKTGLKVDKLLDLILEIDKARRTQLSDSVLNKFLVDIVKIHKPAKAKGVKHPRIYELSQSGTCPPDFKIRIGNKDTLHFSYLHFIQNRLRDKYGFKGTPISMWVKKGR